MRTEVGSVGTPARRELWRWHFCWWVGWKPRAQSYRWRQNCCLCCKPGGKKQTKERFTYCNTLRQFSMGISNGNLERDISPKWIGWSDLNYFWRRLLTVLTKTNNVSTFQVPSYSPLEARACDRRHASYGKGFDNVKNDKSNTSDLLYTLEAKIQQPLS